MGVVANKDWRLVWHLVASSCNAFTVATFGKIVTVYMLVRAHCHRHKCVNSHVIMSLIDIYQFIGQCHPCVAIIRRLLCRMA